MTEFSSLFAQEGTIKTISDWLGSSGIKIFAIIFVTATLSRFLRLIIRRIVASALKRDQFATEQDEKKREDTLVGIIAGVMRIVLWIIAIMIVLSELNLDTGPLVAAGASLGVALGFGAQSLIKDFISGLFIIMENQYRVGDVVEIASKSGTVEAITVRTTVLRDLDGNEHHIPNGIIDVTTNMTMLYSGININIGVSYDSDIEKVKNIVDKVGQKLAKDKEWKDKIEEAPHFLRLNNFNASDVEIKIVGKVKPGLQWSVGGEYKKRLKEAFDKEGIEIPFPQRVVRNVSESK